MFIFLHLITKSVTIEISFFFIIIHINNHTIKYNKYLVFFSWMVFFNNLHLVSSFFLTRSLLVRYTYVSVKLIDWIILSSFELETILLLSSVKILCFSNLNLFRVFDINLLLFMKSLLYFLRLSILFCFF